MGGHRTRPHAAGAAPLMEREVAVPDGAEVRGQGRGAASEPGARERVSALGCNLKVCPLCRPILPPLAQREFVLSERN